MRNNCWDQSFVADDVKLEFECEHMEANQDDPEQSLVSFLIPKTQINIYHTNGWFPWYKEETVDNDCSQLCPEDMFPIIFGLHIFTGSDSG